MVAALLLGVAGEADVVALVLEGDVPQQDGDVAGLGRAHEHHAIVEHAHRRLHGLLADRRITELHEHTHTHTHNDNKPDCKINGQTLTIDFTKNTYLCTVYMYVTVHPWRIE